MTDADLPFLRAICEQPDDDLPRLIYADWLDEHGQPERAEFIRLSCEWAAKDGTLGDLAYTTLRHRVGELMNANHSRWEIALPLMAAAARSHYQWLAPGHYRRGFIEQATVRSEEDLARHLPAILDLVPLKLITVMALNVLRIDIRREDLAWEWVFSRRHGQHKLAAKMIVSHESLTQVSPELRPEVWRWAIRRGLDRLNNYGVFQRVDLTFPPLHFNARCILADTV